MSIPFYDFPSSPILIIGALGIAVAIAVFFVSYQKYFNSPLNKELAERKKALIKDPNYVDYSFRKEQLWGENLQTSTEILLQNEQLKKHVILAKSKINRSS